MDFATFVGIVASLVTIGGAAGVIIYFFREKRGNTERGVIIGVAIILMVVVLVGILVTRPVGNAHQLQGYTSPTNTATRSPKWHAIVQQSAPDCNNPATILWQRQSGDNGNTITCSSSGLFMMQGNANIPETNLMSVNGGYNDNIIQVKVHIHFVNANSPNYNETGAAIIFQAPPTCGGDDFIAFPTGAVALHHINADCSVVSLRDVTVAASADYDLELQIQDGTITCFLNGNAVITAPKDQDGGVTGLFVHGLNEPSANVYFSNFEVDQYM